MTELLETLKEWESRKDHDVGPGYVLNQCYLILYCDGSGKAVVELNRYAEGFTDQRITNLYTNLGMDGRVQKEFGFVTFDEAIEIMSHPIKLEYAR